MWIDRFVIENGVEWRCDLHRPAWIDPFKCTEVKAVTDSSSRFELRIDRFWERLSKNRGRVGGRSCPSVIAIAIVSARTRVDFQQPGNSSFGSSAIAINTFVSTVSKLVLPFNWASIGIPFSAKICLEIATPLARHFQLVNFSIDRFKENNRYHSDELLFLPLILHANELNQNQWSLSNQRAPSHLHRMTQ